MFPLTLVNCGKSNSLERSYHLPDSGWDTCMATKSSSIGILTAFFLTSRPIIIWHHGVDYLTSSALLKSWNECHKCAGKKRSPREALSTSSRLKHVLSRFGTRFFYWPICISLRIWESRIGVGLQHESQLWKCFNYDQKLWRSRQWGHLRSANMERESQGCFQKKLEYFIGPAPSQTLNRAFCLVSSSRGQIYLFQYKILRILNRPSLHKTPVWPTRCQLVYWPCFVTAWRQKACLKQ